MENLQILSLNVRGLRNVTKRKKLFSRLREGRYDVICIQESYITQADVATWKKEWGGELISTEGTKHSKGQLILVRKQFSFDWSIECQHERIVSINLSINGKETTIFNVYAPSTFREMKIFFAVLTEEINKSNSMIKIVCGDFNSVRDNNLDIISGEKHPAAHVKLFNSFVEQCGLNDVWRIFNPETREYTWSKININKFIARRLDYIFTTEEGMDTVIETNLMSVPTSDHRGVRITLKLSNGKKGPGYYKCNNLLLKDKQYVHKINSVIDTYLDENKQENPEQKWELLKIKINEETIRFSKQRAVFNKNKQIDTYNKLESCESDLAREPDNVTLLRKREELKIHLEIHEQERLKSAQTRSRIKWIEEGEKNTKFFLNLEKVRANAKLFPNIELENGDKIHDQFEILKTQKEYYANLYSREINIPDSVVSNSVDNFLGECELPKLSEDEMQQCEGIITIEEASNALRMMKNGSSPGLDGLTTEFVKIFWCKLKDVIVQSFNYSFDHGSLSYTQRAAVLTLLHKGKDLPKNKLTNWRPISLTNTDYKILAKSLANRLSKVINKVVNEDQVGYMKGRHVSSTIRTIDDVIEYCRINRKPGILLALDFQKAFDSISKKYMICAFRKFGFGKDFIQWVNVLFNETRSCIVYNGWLSENFDVKCGIRQGCPFSPMAFIIGLEFLAIRFRQSNEVKGLNVTCRNILKILLYADDITLFLRDADDVTMVLQIIDVFSEVSGLCLNKLKSEAMGIGSSKNINFNFEVKCVRQIKILGVNFNSEKSASEIELNWSSKIDKIKQSIFTWEKRNLGIPGKICIIKTFLLSQLVYLMQSICIPDKVLQEINTILYRFLWRKKDCNKKAFEKVKRVVLNSSTEKGGIDMIDVKTMQNSFLCQWLSKLSSGNLSCKWTWIPNKYFEGFGCGFACFTTAIRPSKFKGIGRIKSIFWTAVARTWLEHNTISQNDCVQDNCLWNNPSISYQNNVLYYENWARSGITYVGDMLGNHGIKSYPAIQASVYASPGLYLEYIVVRSAVSEYIKKSNYDPNQPVLNRQNNLLFNKTSIKSARQFREYIVEEKYTTPRSINFWRDMFGINVDQSHWNLAKNVTQESRLRELHWKILHTIYPTNVLLYKIGIRDSVRCPFCPTEIDYVEHFFVNCKKIKVLWRYVEQIIYEKYKIRIVFGVEHILCGYINGADSIKCKYINHLILIGKMCISKYRYGTPTDIIIMFDKEKQIRNVE